MQSLHFLIHYIESLRVFISCFEIRTFSTVSSPATSNGFLRHLFQGMHPAFISIPLNLGPGAEHPQCKNKNHAVDRFYALLGQKFLSSRWIIHYYFYQTSAFLSSQHSIALYHNCRSRTVYHFLTSSNAAMDL
jgi:hypothetical protein